MFCSTLKKDPLEADALKLASELCPLELSPSWTRSLIDGFLLFLVPLLNFLSLIMVLLNDMSTVCLTFVSTGCAQCAWTESLGRLSPVFSAPHKIRNVMFSSPPGYSCCYYYFFVFCPDRDGIVFILLFVRRSWSIDLKCIYVVFAADDFTPKTWQYRLC